MSKSKSAPNKKKNKMLITVVIAITAVVLAAAIVTCVVINSSKPRFAVTTYGNSKCEFENVSLSIVDYKFTNNKREITVEWNNQSDNELFLTDDFEIYSLGIATWDEITPVNSPDYENVAYTVSPKQTYQKTYDVSPYFPQLQKGAYQFRANIHLSSYSFLSTLDFSVEEEK